MLKNLITKPIFPLIALRGIIQSKALENNSDERFSLLELVWMAALKKEAYYQFINDTTRGLLFTAIKDHLLHHKSFYLIFHDNGDTIILQEEVIGRKSVSGKQVIKPIVENIEGLRLLHENVVIRNYLRN